MSAWLDDLADHVAHEAATGINTWKPDMTKEPTEAQIKIAGITRLIAQRDTERAEHEAFRQRVSEIVAPVHRALKQSPDGNVNHLADHLLSLILPNPTPTPEQVLAEALVHPSWAMTASDVEWIVTELAKRGHHVAPIKDTRHD